MATHIAFLRGINVGGNIILLMSELKSICDDLGFENVRTFIQSGNVVFESNLSEEVLMNELEGALQDSKQKRIPVIIRSVNELESVISCNPFPNTNPAQVGVLFLSTQIPKDLLTDITIPSPEEVVVSGREIYIHYPNGMGRSKLKLPAMTQQGTVRNINTVAKLVKLSQDTINKR
jgi:uncharacterized protein (DUF1697 family)